MGGKRLGFPSCGEKQGMGAKRGALGRPDLPVVHSKLSSPLAPNSPFSIHYSTFHPYQRFNSSRSRSMGRPTTLV